MKTLYITDDRFPPFRADVVDLFARELVARGHVIDWMMRRGPGGMDAPRCTEWLGNRIVLSPAVKRRGAVGRILNTVLEAWGDLFVLPLAQRSRYDVVLVRDRFLVALWAWFAARISGARFVYWMSYPFAESKIDQARKGFVPHPWLTWLKGQWIRLLIYRAVLPLADHVFVQSQRMKEDVMREGVAAMKLTPVPMGIRADRVGRAEDAREPNTAAPLLLHLGIILRLRQTEMLVRVLAKVRQRYPAARLRYVGEGQHPSDRQAILDEAERLGLQDAVEVTGFLPTEQAWAHVKAADICFSPFYPIPVLLSTSPTKLVEYLAMAKCVVANEHPEQTQVLLESGVGRTVPWDEDAFAQAIFDLLANPARARENAARGPDYVRRNRTYPIIAEQVDNVLTGLLRPARGT
jgi:glycosyltransferase involved in cell wall biosynthesis